MKKLISDFTKHLKESLETWKKVKFKDCDKDIKNVLICGVGGSGIGGTIISQLTSKKSSVPIIVNKGYDIPGFVGENTLVIINSYSGDTEETIEMMNHAQNSGAEIVCLTSGGTIKTKAIENEYNHVIVSGGNPPRAAFGLTIPMLFFILNKYDIIPNCVEDFEESIKLLDYNENDIIFQSKILSDSLFDKTPIIYSDTLTEGVCVRFRQQLNENSKLLCWHHTLPEMNHNELVGWTGNQEDKTVVIFRNKNDHEKVQKRIEIAKGIISNHTSNIIEIYSKGETDLQRALYLIHLGDWASYFIAEKRGVDVVEVEVIDYLKSEMQK